MMAKQLRTNFDPKEAKNFIFKTDLRTKCISTYRINLEDLSNSMAEVNIKTLKQLREAFIDVEGNCNL